MSVTRSREQSERANGNMWENKVAIVTGAASGIGYLTAERFAMNGVRVALLDVNPTTVEVAAEKIRKQGGCADAYAVDIRDYAAVEAAVNETYRKYGRLDIIVNCAGGASSRVFGRKETFRDMPVEVLDWGIDVNLKGQIYMARAGIGYMMEQGSGVIINLGSVVGQTGGTSVDYSAAKSGAMNGLTKSLALYGAPYGVRVCCVTPGPVLTRPGMAKMKTPLGRAAQPEEIVDLIEYLTSDKAGFITGTNYLIDGGRSCGGMS